MHPFLGNHSGLHSNGKGDMLLNHFNAQGGIVSTNVGEMDAAIREAMKIVDQVEDERKRSEKLRTTFDIICHCAALP